MLLRAECRPLEVPHCVRQRSHDVGRAAKEAERVIVAEDRYAVCPRGAANGERAIEVNAAVIEGLGQRDRIEMDRSDDVGTRRQVLAMNRLQGTRCKHRRQDKFGKSSHPSITTSIVKSLSAASRTLVGYTNPFPFFLRGLQSIFPIFEGTRESQLSIARTGI